MKAHARTGRRGGARLVLVAALLCVAFAAALLARSRTPEVEPAPPPAVTRTPVSRPDTLAPRPVAPSEQEIPVVAAPAPEPEWDGNGPPSRAYARARLSALIEARFADRQLSSGDLEAAVEAALRLHELRRDLAELEDTPDQRWRIDELRERERREADELRSILEVEAFDVPTLR